ncbi:MAG TPA: glutamate--tRNA ligase [Candidatus Saccharimonadales bacterium]|nr:glutamate--tRNA ligase [Candidatus Saccharimonadales bacterium]
MNVRTRFAPSPTGFLHVGGIRTALFAWLVARQAGGQFILRIEDTDRAREVKGAEAHIIESLRALGLDYDEGPDMPGEYGPYRQTERLERYKTWAQVLIDSGRAYADPYSTEEVQAFREQAQKEKQPFLYRNHRPENPPAWDGRQPLRFRSDPKDYAWHDAVMGDLHAGAESIDDFILVKSDGFPTYNFAHIVDDHDMAITHVIRGQEFIASVPNYLNLYEALGFDVPVLATMPHILNEQGNKKLSKRDGAKDVLDYIKDGYPVEAMINFIASLGWNDGTEQEIFSREELIKKFSLDRVQKSGARFDERRLLWMSGSWIRRLDISDIYTRCQSFWPGSAENYDDDYKKQVLLLVQERLKFFGELPQLTDFFFEDLPVNLELITGNKQLKKHTRSDLLSWLEQARASLEQSDFATNDLTDRLNDLLEQTGQKPGVLFSLIRVATTWAPSSPGLADTLHILGKDRTLQRLTASLEALS